MSSIGSISSSTTTQTIHASSRRRPDPAEMAEKLFSQLDASGQGYISKSDLESAMSKVGSSSGTSSIFQRRPSLSVKVWRAQAGASSSATAGVKSSTFRSPSMRVTRSAALLP